MKNGFTKVLKIVKDALNRQCISAKKAFFVYMKQGYPHFEDYILIPTFNAVWAVCRCR